MPNNASLASGFSQSILISAVSAPFRLNAHRLSPLKYANIPFFPLPAAVILYNGPAECKTFFSGKSCKSFSVHQSSTLCLNVGSSTTGAGVGLTGVDFEGGGAAARGADRVRDGAAPADARRFARALCDRARLRSRYHEPRSIDHPNHDARARRHGRSDVPTPLRRAARNAFHTARLRIAARQRLDA